MKLGLQGGSNRWERVGNQRHLSSSVLFGTFCGAPVLPPLQDAVVPARFAPTWQDSVLSVPNWFLRQTFKYFCFFCAQIGQRRPKRRTKQKPPFRQTPVGLGIRLLRVLVLDGSPRC